MQSKLQREVRATAESAIGLLRLLTTSRRVASELMGDHLTAFELNRCVTRICRQWGIKQDEIWPSVEELLEDEGATVH